MVNINESEVENTASDTNHGTSLTQRGKLIVALLAIYLMLLLLLSINWFTGLMVANTSSQVGVSAAKCTAPANVNADPTANNNASNINSNLGQNSNAGTATVNSNAAVPTGNTNVNRPNSNAAANQTGGTAAGTRMATNGSTNTSTKTADAESGSGLQLPSMIVIDDYTFLGYWSVKSFTNNGCVTDDGYLFLIVLFGGMMGAILRALIYFCWRVGTKNFVLGWAWYYVFQPFLGSALAVVVYVVIRGGFSSGAIGKGNLYAFAAVALLTGLFSDNAMSKLKLVAESLLVKVDPRPKPEDKKKNETEGSTARKKAGDNKAASTDTQTTDGDDSSGGRTPGTMAPDEPPV